MASGNLGLLALAGLVGYGVYTVAKKRDETRAPSALPPIPPPPSQPTGGLDPQAVQVWSNLQQCAMGLPLPPGQFVTPGHASYLRAYLGSLQPDNQAEQDWLNARIGEVINWSNMCFGAGTMTSGIHVGDCGCDECAAKRATGEACCDACASGVGACSCTNRNNQEVQGKA